MKKLQTRTSLKSNRPLKQETPLGAKSLKAADKPKKQALPAITKLKKAADKHFSQYVRLRDCEYDPLGEPPGWYGKCVTCNKYGLVAWVDDKGSLRFTSVWSLGHYISRGNWYLRFDEENCNLQCKMNCNNMRSGNIERYKLELDLKYGAGTRLKLDRDAQDNKDYRITRVELEQVIHDSREQVRFYERQALNAQS